MKEKQAELLIELFDDIMASLRNLDGLRELITSVDDLTATIEDLIEKVESLEIN